MEIASF